MKHARLLPLIVACALFIENYGLNRDRDLAGSNDAAHERFKPMKHARLLPLIVACALFIENMDSTAIATSLGRMTSRTNAASR